MSSYQSQDAPQVGVPFLGLCLKLADFGDASQTSFPAHSAPSSSSNEDLIMAHLELSVHFEELREEFNHLIECHWVPLQRFSQEVLVALSALANAPINEGLFCRGCGDHLQSPVAQGVGMDKGFPLPSLLPPLSPEYSPTSPSRVGVHLLHLVLLFVPISPF